MSAGSDQHGFEYPGATAFISALPRVTVSDCLRVAAMIPLFSVPTSINPRKSLRAGRRLSGPPELAVGHPDRLTHDYEIRTEIQQSGHSGIDDKHLMYLPWKRFRMTRRAGCAAARKEMPYSRSASKRAFSDISMEAGPPITSLPPTRQSQRIRNVTFEHDDPFANIPSSIYARRSRERHSVTMCVSRCWRQEHAAIRGLER